MVVSNLQPIPNLYSDLFLFDWTETLASANMLSSRAGSEMAQCVKWLMLAKKPENLSFTLKSHSGRKEPTPGSYLLISTGAILHR